MSVLIVGGAGFIGAALARMLVNAGQKPICMDVSLDPVHLREVASQVTLIRGDVTQFEDVVGAILAHGVDQVVSLAYLPMASSEEYLQLGVRVNVLGMNNVFEAARLTRVRRVLYASSTAYLGTNPSPEPRTIDEDEPPQPSGIYGWAKHFNEQMASRYAAKYGMTMVCVRPAAVFRPGRTHGFALHSRLINEAALEHPVTVNAHPAAETTLVHVDDVAEIFFRLSQAEVILHAAYNTGGDRITNQGVADLVRAYLPDVRITFNPEAPAPAGAQPPYDYDPRRLKEDLDFVRPPLSQRVLDTINVTRASAGLPAVGTA